MKKYKIFFKSGNNVEFHTPDNLVEWFEKCCADSDGKEGIVYDIWAKGSVHNLILEHHQVEAIFLME